MARKKGKVTNNNVIGVEEKKDWREFLKKAESSLKVLSQKAQVVARELEKQYLARGGISEIGITLNLEEPLPEIWVAPGHISEVFRTLIENSFDAMEETGGEVIITSRFQDDNIVVEVKDTGPGIPANVADKLFHKPVPSDKLGGSTGLGLWLTGLLLLKWFKSSPVIRPVPTTV